MSGRNVREWREKAGMSTAELARRIGVTPHKLGRVEREEVLLKADDAAKIAKVLGVEASKLLGAMAQDTEQDARRSVSADDSMIPVYGPARSLDQGGIVVGKDSVRGWAERPPELRDVEDAFAVWQNDNAMFPRYAPGELLYCNPFKPPSVGDDVVAVISDGRGNAAGRVRRLLAIHPDVLELRTLAPEGTEIVQRERVRALAVVIGMRPRGG